MKKNSERIRKPNAFLYEATLLGFRIYNKFAYHLKVVRNETKNLKPPYVFLNNHPSNRDIVGAAMVAYPKRVNCVAGFFLFSDALSRWAFRQVGAIPKSQFAPDISSVKQMIYCARNERVLMLFPEGQIGPFGKENELPPGLGKLLRTMGVPVVMNTLHGAYLSTPKWANVKRRRYIEADCRVILTAEQVKTMKPAEIEETVRRELAYNDYEWQRLHMIPYKCKAPAEGLERVCYRCPRCGAEMQIETKGDTVTCRACGNTGVMDVYGFLHGKTPEDVIPETVLQWHDEQYAALAQEVKQEDFSMTQKCTLRYLPRGGKKTDAGTGTVTIDKSGIRYEGTFFGKPFTLEGKASSTYGLPFTAGVLFEIPHGTDLYEVLPEHPMTVMKWVDAMDLIHKASL